MLPESHITKMDAEALVEVPTQSVRIRESIQAGDVFLLRFECPKCSEEVMEGFPLKTCGNCKSDLSEFAVEITSKRVQRLLCGSYRKHRIGKRIIQVMMEAQGRRCAYCLALLDGTLHVEHIIPLAVGGTSEHRNLCLSCPDCNRKAGSLAFPSFDRKREFILKARKIA